MRKVIIDAEFNGLQPDKIWCIVCKDIDNGVSSTFRFDRPEDNDRFRAFISSVSCWIGHHIIQYDVPNINKLLGTKLDWKKCIDTLVVSRLIHYEKPGGHSVENWGKQFGLEKKFISVWDDPNLIDDYVKRCEYDVEIQYRIYKELERFIKDPSWRAALRVEHDIQYICRDMHVNGFAFDKDKAELLLSQIKTEMAELEEQIRSDVPPVLVKSAPIKLKVNKDGNPSRKTSEVVGCSADISDGSDYFRFHYEPFNPGSPKQRITFLNSVGWRPVEKTKGHITCERQIRAIQHKINRLPDRLKQIKKKELEELSQRLEYFKEYGWKVNETNLDTLPQNAPRGAHLLAKWLCLEGRRGDLEEWLAAYLPSTGRIHGSFNGIGAWSHRMSHVRPNQGNIFSNFTKDQCRGDVSTPVEDIKLKFNGELRSLWQASEGKLLVGTDAEGIQMRILAHYINDPDYTEAIVNGNKEDGTDVHSLNRKLLGDVCRSRDTAKTFIYAWLLGAGVAKVAEILGCSYVQARSAMDSFVRNVPGLDELKRLRIPSDARRGYFVGLDGRKVICKSERLVITGYLQNGEAVVMKHANTLWRQRAKHLDYKQVDFVHDEWVCEVPDEDTGHELGQLQSQVIGEIGEDLGLNCALAGEYKLGRNWLEVH